MSDHVKMLSEGAEGRIFETTMFGKAAVVKQRHAKAYRIKELDENLRRTRTRKEARAMQKIREAGVRVPSLLGLGEFSIYMEKVQGKLLKDALNGHVDYKKLGKMLAKMHNAGVIHGDFTPANVMLGESGLCIIDFGLADINNSVEDRALDLLLMKRSIAKPDYEIIQAAYTKEYSKSRDVIVRLAEIEKRGRYQVRTLA